MDKPVTRLVSYETRGFATLPWRIGSVTAPVAPRRGHGPTTWDRTARGPERLVALELVGSAGVVRDVARILRSGSWVSLLTDGPTSSREHVLWAPGGMVTVSTVLPSGPVHALLLHPQATVTDCDPTRPVYAIGRAPLAAQAARMLTTVLPIPLLPDWIPILLEAGQEAGLVVPLSSDGLLQGVEIIPDVGAWADLVTHRLRTGRLPWTP